MAKCWAACAVASLAVLALGQTTGFAWSIIGVSAAALATLVFVKVLMVDWLTLAEIVRLIERHHPGLNKLLETASEQIAKNDPDKLDYLQQRVLADALKASREQGWELEANGRLALTHLYHGAALSVFLVAFWQMSDTTASQTVRSAKGSVVVEPGDVEVERGTSLIVSA
ncbi:uncharacterized protein METZ01_LOCUS140684, partial [marine metagenome]